MANVEWDINQGSTFCFCAMDEDDCIDGTFCKGELTNPDHLEILATKIREVQAMVDLKGNPHNIKRITFDID